MTRARMPSALVAAAALLLAGCGGEEHNEADVAFASGMVPHHEQAVSMSRTLLEKEGVPAEVRDVAEAIASAQDPEVELMISWLEEWEAVTTEGAAADAGHGDEASAHGHAAGGHEAAMDHAEGMLSAEELGVLAEADGPEAARLFLEGMVRHHEGAVAMSEEVLASGSDPDVRELAETVIEVQRREIHDMEHLLEG